MENTLLLLLLSLTLSHTLSQSPPINNDYGACNNTKDRGIIKKLGKTALSEHVALCATPCVGSPECVGRCLHNAIDLSLNCGICFGKK